MLDLNTALYFLLAVSAVDGVIALLVWLTQRQVTGLAMIAVGWLIFAIAVWMINLTDVPSVTLRNILFNLSLALAAEGMAGFLGRRQFAWLPIAVVVFTAVFWPVAQLWIAEPHSVPLRVMVSATIGIAIIGRMAWLTIGDRTQPLPLRLVTLGCLVGIVGLLSFRFASVALHPWTQSKGQPQLQAWFYFGVCIGTNFLFFCLLTMVGVRLSKDLRHRNRELATEVNVRTRVQTELSQALQSERQIREDRRQFLHVLGHEINTPLAIISKSVEMIELAPSTASRRLETIQSAVRRLFRLNANLLAAERASLDTTRLEQLDAVQIAVEAVGGYQDVALAADASQEPLCFVGDRDMMAMALINLIDNARKFSPAGLPVTLAAGRSGGEVVFTVEDRGMGIPADEIISAGQRHFRASNAKSVRGTGMGLHIVSLIMERHQGRLEVTNRPGGGATARLIVPAVDHYRPDQKIALGEG